MNDVLQRKGTRVDELEGENKYLEGKLREQESKVDHLDTNLEAAELKLEDSLSKIRDLCAEVEIKTVHISQLREVSSMLSLLCGICTMLLPLIWANKLACVNCEPTTQT
jgi:predicted RNase H-like nuclease (RuvC/YqgF family)